MKKEGTEGREREVERKRKRRGDREGGREKKIEEMERDRREEEGEKQLTSAFFFSLAILPVSVFPFY